MEKAEKLFELVANQLGVEKEKIELGSSFIDDLGADSLDTVELIMALEETVGIEIPDEDAEQLKTVQNVIDYLEHKDEKIA